MIEISFHMKTITQSHSQYCVTLAAPPMASERRAHLRLALKQRFPTGEFQFEDGMPRITAMKCTLIANPDWVNGSKKGSEAKMQTPKDCEAILSSVNAWLTNTGWWR